MRRFQWKKKGLVFEPNITEGFTHGMLPCVIHIKNDEFIVAFCSRNAEKKSHIFLCRAQVSNGNFELRGNIKLALSPGPLGHFDCDGVLSSSFLIIGENKYLYYGGWENLVSVPYTANTGRLIFNEKDLSLEREFPCPILSKNPQSPIFSGAPAFVTFGDEIWAWYTSAIRWEKTRSGFKHYYSLRRAVSQNGIDWISDPEFTIPFADEHEYAVARSTILHEDGIYYMWFSHRATKDIPTYRIGFAYSKDCLKWERDDSSAGIDVSPLGWDSEMICYPQVFRHGDWLYMIYNGNNYGETGFGYAVCKL